MKNKMCECTDVRVRWIDCIKAIAIIAVLVDHSWGELYFSKDLQFASWFAVSLFILSAGITEYRSLAYKTKSETWFVYFLHRIKKIMVAYLVATFIYQMFEYKVFDLKQWIEFVLNFNATSAFYYILLYVSLMILSTPLYNLLRDSRGGKDGLLFLGIILFSVLTVNYTNIFNIYGGGGKAFGGTYLILFLGGMLIGKYEKTDNNSIKKELLIAFVGTVSWLFWWRIECLYRQQIDNIFPFGEGINPPGVCLMIFALLSLIVIRSWAKLLSYFRSTSILVDGLAYIGKHTLYIYLYHILILRVIILPNFSFSNIWSKRIICFSFMIGGSLLFEYIITKIQNTVIRLYQNVD